MKDALRANRTILAPASGSRELPLATIYLGLYNAHDYLESLEHQLSSQESNVPIVVVDNYSEDDTWQKIQPWFDLFEGRISIVRNPINLGGAGSLYLNSDLIKTEWFITLHQDDFYFPNHVSTLCNEMKLSSAGTICISTEMGSLSPSGKVAPTPPRASWFLPDNSPETLFLSNLRLHNVPFPASAFRTSTFFAQETAWHSTAFPDTEWVLGSVTKGEFRFVPTQTMRYRENPKSESHSIDGPEKIYGAATALLRVFSNPNFRRLCEGVSAEHQEAFAKSCLTGIGIRLGGENEIANLVKLSASEQMTSVWGYGSNSATTYIRDFYRSAGSSRIPKFLESLGVEDESGYISVENLNLNSRSTSQWQLNDISSSEKESLTSKHFHRTALIASMILPARLKRLLFRVLSQKFRGFLNDSPWGYQWK